MNRTTSLTGIPKFISAGMCLVMSGPVVAEVHIDSPPMEDLGKIGMVILNRRDPLPIDGHLSEMKIGDSLQTVLRLINPNGQSAKFFFMTKKDEGEYLAIEAFPIRPNETDKKNPSFCCADFLFCNKSLIGLTSFDLAKKENKSANGDSTNTTIIKMIDSYIQSAVKNKLNTSFLQYSPAVEVTPDPGLTVAGAVMGLLPREDPLPYIGITKLINIKGSKDLQNIDPTAHLDIPLTDKHEYLGSVMLAPSDSEVGILTDKSNGNVIVILAYGMGDSLEIPEKK